MSTGRDNATWVHLAGKAARDGWSVAIDETTPGWSHTGLLTATLASGESRTLDLGDREAVVVPLSGAVDLSVTTASGESHAVRMRGRSSVFAGPTDVAYVPPGSHVQLTGPAGAASESRVAICLAVDHTGVEPLPFHHLSADDVPVELRGAGVASRQVRNFGVPGVLDAHRIIACEVITPAGNWSSWPPHKHDTERPGVESELEEIYYFETRSIDAHSPNPRGTDPMGYQRVYAGGDRAIDVLAEVRSGDVVLVPHGWHGPAIAAPDADLYYLNVMAGPGPERAWLICDDPAHAWVRDTWPDLAPDPRLT